MIFESRERVVNLNMEGISGHRVYKIMLKPRRVYKYRVPQKEVTECLFSRTVLKDRAASVSFLVYGCCDCAM